MISATELFFIRHKKEILSSILVVITGILILTLIRQNTSNSLNNMDVLITTNSSPTNQTLFPVQCIDTMKVSRDRAKEKMSVSQREQMIQRQVREIASLGANCIAIATPYNQEFLPVLRIWVAEARKEKLHIWFRGNWAEWEGWFGYPQNMTVANHIARTTAFVLDNSDLFQNGDIFTAAPEAENGGPFNPVDSPQKYQLFRSFLATENAQLHSTFSHLGIQVTTNWISMSGGVAKAVVDESLSKNLTKIITLDHYVKNSSEIDEYITYFTKKFDTNIVFGEFGAPIPDINGRMTQDQQAEFVGQLLTRLYANRSVIKGVNYWTLSESSTSLVDSHQKEKKSAHVLETFYKPALVTGRVVNTAGEAVSAMTIKTADNLNVTQTNKKGEFQLLLPGTSTNIILEDNEKYVGESFMITPKVSESLSVSVTVKPQKLLFLYRIKLFIHTLLTKK